MQKIVNKEIHTYYNDIKYNQLDTFEKRLNNIKLDKDYHNIDLSKLNINNFNDIIIKLNSILDIQQIDNLFLNNNNISNLIDLSNFTKLSAIDICNNKLSSILVNNCVIELSIDNNNITNLPYLDNIKRIKASDNKINRIMSYPNLEILIVSNNNISEIDFCSNLKKLIINDNPLCNLYNMDNITYLDISATNLINLNYNFNNLIHLVANNCKFKDLPKKEQMPNINTIEVISTPINKINFYPKFNLILCSLTLTKNISSKYKDNSTIKIKNNNIICISNN